MTVPGKSWVTIPTEEENSSSIANAIRRGFLVRSVIAEVVTPEPIEKIVEPKAAVAETLLVVQNQTPKLEVPSKAAKASKSEAPAESTDEPKSKRE